MNAACPTCKQIALPSARYCRACYTIFTPVKPAPPRKQSESRAWQLLLLLVLAIGGWWTYRSDTGRGEAHEDWTESAGSGSFGSSADDAGSRASDGAERRSPTAAFRAPAGTWLLELNSHRVCGAAAECEVSLRFASGASARFAVQRRSGSSSALVPLEDDGGVLLGRHFRATLLPDRASEGVAITRSGRSWGATGGV